MASGARTSGIGVGPRARPRLDGRRLLAGHLVALDVADRGGPRVRLLAASPSLAATGGYFAVSVADLHASETWYIEKLGLELAMQPPTANGVSVVLLRGDGLTVELIHQDKGVSLRDMRPDDR